MPSAVPSSLSTQIRADYVQAGWTGFFMADADKETLNIHNDRLDQFNGDSHQYLLCCANSLNFSTEKLQLFS